MVEFGNNGTQNGPEGCNIGVAIIPGSASDHSQFAQFDGKGVMGDQSASYDLLMQPSNSLGIIGFSEVDNGWSGGTNATEREVLISTENGGAILNLTFTGGTYHSGPAQTVPVFDIESGASGAGLYNLIVNAVSVDCWLSSTACTVGVKMNSGDKAGLLSPLIFLVEG